MQKRIFGIGGQPFMATRDGAYWETHGTLLRLVEESARGGADPADRPPERPSQPQESSAGDATPTAEVQKGVDDAPGPATTLREEDARAPARNTRRRRVRVEPSASRDGEGTACDRAETPVGEPAAADAPEATRVLREARAEGAEGQPESVVRRTRRIRQPKVPRWTTAGMERRGRLK